MGRLLIGNAYSDNLVGDLEAYGDVQRRTAGNYSLRMIWQLEPGDVLVLPQEPGPDFLAYVLSLKRLARSEVSIVVPPAGRFGTDVVSSDRLLDPQLLDHLRMLVTSKGLDRVVAYSFDRAVATLARHLGLNLSTPGFGFMESGGGELLNSKAVFRTLAAGAGVPVADGIATTSLVEGLSFVRSLLRDGKAAIAKQDLNMGGLGNEILAPSSAVRQLGAAHLAVLEDPTAIEAHLRERWPFYTNDGRARVVIEDYVPESLPIGAEVEITHSGTVLRHVGEMIMSPTFDGVLLPGEPSTAAPRGELIEAVLALSDSARAMGYRGLANIDGVVTPGGRMFLTEFNARQGGTTHMHWIGENLVGPHYQDTCVILARNHLPVVSFASAVDVLSREGLAFDETNREGVVLTCDHSTQCGVVEYCVIAADVTAANGIAKALLDVFQH